MSPYELSTTISGSLIILDLNDSYVDKTRRISCDYEEGVFTSSLGSICFSSAAGNLARSESAGGAGFQWCPLQGDNRTNAAHFFHAFSGDIANIYVNNEIVVVRFWRLSTLRQRLVSQDVDVLDIGIMTLVEDKCPCGLENTNCILYVISE